MHSQSVDDEPWDDGAGILVAMWRHRLAVVVLVPVALLAGVGAAMLQPERYAATALVTMADPREDGVFAGDPAGDDDRRQQNRVERFTSAAVLTRAAAMIGSSLQLSELRDVVAAVPEPVADQIRVTVTSGDAALSRDLANAVVEAYREQYRADALADAERTIAVLDAEVAALVAELDELEETISAAFPPPDPDAEVAPEPLLPPGELAVLNVRRDALATMLRTTLVTRREIRVEARATEDVDAVEPAELPLASTADPMLVLGLAGVVGVAAAALVAVWLEERARTRRLRAAASAPTGVAATRVPGPAPDPVPVHPLTVPPRARD